MRSGSRRQIDVRHSACDPQEGSEANTDTGHNACIPDVSVRNHSRVCNSTNQKGNIPEDTHTSQKNATPRPLVLSSRHRKTPNQYTIYDCFTRHHRCRNPPHPLPRHTDIYLLGLHRYIDIDIYVRPPSRSERIMCAGCTYAKGEN